MVGFYRMVARAAGLIALLLILIPLTASATVTGGCTVSATASISGTKDLTGTDVWHLRTDDVVNGSANYPTQTFVHASAFIFGVPVPVYSASGHGTHGSAGPFKVSDYSRYTRIFPVGGVSDSCTGAVLIVVDDQNPFTNVVGLVGSILAAIGVVGLAVAFFAGSRVGGCFSRLLVALSGLLAGLGTGFVAIEAGLLDPRSVAGLVVVGVGLVLGVAIPIVRGGTPRGRSSAGG